MSKVAQNKVQQITARIQANGNVGLFLALDLSDDLLLSVAKTLESIVLGVYVADGNTLAVEVKNGNPAITGAKAEEMVAHTLGIDISRQVRQKDGSTTDFGADKTIILRKIFTDSTLTSRFPVLLDFSVLNYDGGGVEFITSPTSKTSLLSGLFIGGEKVAVNNFSLGGIDD